MFAQPKPRASCISVPPHLAAPLETWQRGERQAASCQRRLINELVNATSTWGHLSKAGDMQASVRAGGLAPFDPLALPHADPWGSWSHLPECCRIQCLLRQEHVDALRSLLSGALPRWPHLSPLLLGLSWTAAAADGLDPRPGFLAKSHMAVQLLEGTTDIKKATGCSSLALILLAVAVDTIARRGRAPPRALPAALLWHLAPFKRVAPGRLHCCLLPAAACPAVQQQLAGGRAPLPQPRMVAPADNRLADARPRPQLGGGRRHARHQLWPGHHCADGSCGPRQPEGVRGRGGRRGPPLPLHRHRASGAGGCGLPGL